MSLPWSASLRFCTNNISSSISMTSPPSSNLFTREESKSISRTTTWTAACLMRSSSFRDRQGEGRSSSLPYHRAHHHGCVHPEDENQERQKMPGHRGSMESHRHPSDGQLYKITSTKPPENTGRWLVL